MNWEYQPRPDIISRDEWGAGEPKVKGSNTPTQIIVHHTGDPEDNIAKNFPNDDEGFMLREYEIAVNGDYDDFPYNWAIGLHGTIMEGRDPNYKGGHEPRVNSSSLSVTVLGNYELSDFENIQEESLIDMLAYLCFRYDIDASRIKGHKDIRSTKLCPGKNIYKRLQAIRNEVALRLYGDIQ